MTKKNYFAAFAATLLLVLLGASCQPKESDREPEESTLTLSTTSVSLDNKAQTAQAITVTTNQPKILVSAPGTEWLEASLQGNNILIKVAANEFGKERKTEVLVFAGAATEKILVTQSAADIVLEISPNELVVENKGGELFASVKSNSANWQIEPVQMDWITVEKFTSEIIKIIVKPNNNANSREGALYAKLGNSTKEIKISQVGKSGEKFFLPLLEARPRTIDLVNFETNRGNLMIRFLDALPAWQIYDRLHQFACTSEVFTAMDYTFDVSINKMREIRMYTEDQKVIKSKELREYLESNGFVLGKAKEDGTYSGVNEKLLFKVETELVSTSNVEPFGRANLVFTPIVKQTESFPTFSKFPYDNSIVLDNSEWKQDKIIENEKSKGNTVKELYSEFFPEVVQAILVQQQKSSNPEVPHARLYFLNVNEETGESTEITAEMITVWEEYTLGAWIDEGAMHVTNEFIELATKEGFKLLKEDNGTKFLYNEAKDIVIVPRGNHFKDLLDGAPVFSINYFKLGGEGQNLSDPIIKSMLIKKLSERVTIQDKLLHKM